MRARTIANPLPIGLTIAIIGIVGHAGTNAIRIPGLFKGSEPIDHPEDGGGDGQAADGVEEEEEDYYEGEEDGQHERRAYEGYDEEMYEAIIHDDEEGGDGGMYRAEDGDANHDMVVTFLNQFPNTSIDVYWEGGEDVDEFGNAHHVRKFEGTISPRGGSMSVNTNEGHEFSYDHDGERHYITLREPNAYGDQLVVLAGHVREGFLVRCDLKQRDDASSRIGPLEIIVNPYWAPRGASRFMELVRRGYYDGTALNRVVPNFLVQFGISRDINLRDEFAGSTIFDDMPNQFKFQPGFVSFAGSGHDSRTTEIFIVMPGTPQEQLDYFGENSWETPFGVVIGDAEHRVLTEIYSGYGDMSSMGGNGPDSSRIYDADGYDYLHDEFPLLDYIDRCFIVDEESSALAEEEL